MRKGRASLACHARMTLVLIALKVPLNLCSVEDANLFDLHVCCRYS